MSTVSTTENITRSADVPHVDWAAIIAGAILASAIGFILMTFGSGLGLSLVDIDGRDGASPVLIAALVGLWTAWVVVSSFMAGSYLAGRLRRRSYDATAHEVDVRDGSHGLTVWALGVLLGGYLAAMGVANVTGAVASGAQSAVSAGASAVSDTDPMALVTDQLMRSAVADLQPAGNMDDVRSEASRLIASSIASGEFLPEDQAYLASLVQRVTGANAEDAQARVTNAIDKVEELATQATAVAESARKTSILIAFLLAAILIVSAAASWWAATIGGKHRDEGIDFSHLTRWK